MFNSLCGKKKTRLGTLCNTNISETSALSHRPTHQAALSFPQYQDPTSIFFFHNTKHKHRSCLCVPFVFHHLNTNNKQEKLRRSVEMLLLVCESSREYADVVRFLKTYVRKKTNNKHGTISVHATSQVFLSVSILVCSSECISVLLKVRLAIWQQHERTQRPSAGKRQADRVEVGQHQGAMSRSELSG